MQNPNGKPEQQETSYLLSPCFLPPVFWFAPFMKQGRVVLDDTMPYRPQTAHHRAQIKGPNDLQLLVVPVAKEAKHGKIDAAQIRSPYKWPIHMQRTLQTAYGRSPFFEYYNEVLEHLSEEKFLLELNLSLIYWIAREMDWNRPLLRSECAHDEVFVDLRGLGLDKQAPVWFNARPYSQAFGSFVANLSVVDALFCLGPELQDYLITCSKALEFELGLEL